jgi:hypothetical protein
MSLEGITYQNDNSDTLNRQEMLALPNPGFSGSLLFFNPHNRSNQLVCKCPRIRILFVVPGLIFGKVVICLFFHLI